MTESKTPQSSTSSARLLGLARMRPVLRARDVSAHGLHTGTLTRMARAGTLEKVGPGRYRLATSDVTESHSLVLACSIVPSSVVCLSTALLFLNSAQANAATGGWSSMRSKRPSERFTAIFAALEGRIVRRREACIS